MKKNSNYTKLTATPGKKHKVAKFDPEYTGKFTKKSEAEDLLEKNVKRLRVLQDKLYAQNKYSVLIIFQAMDAAGKDGTIKHVMSGVNPQGCQVYSFKQPSKEELDHDYMWRCYKCLPERGRIGIFNRSYYEEVLVTRVHPELLLYQQLPGIDSEKEVEKLDSKFWKIRYENINNIEKHLTESGTIVIKFFLNVSNKEQRKRFLARIDDESKNWKFSLDDVTERSHWKQYMEAYSDMLTNTSTKYAPWYVIPADNKWYMRYVVSDIIAARLEELNLAYPDLPSTAVDQLAKARLLLESEKNGE